MESPVDNLDDRLADAGVSAIRIDGFDAATMGYAEAGDGYALVYSYWRCLEVLIESNGWPYDDAVEYFEFNVMGSIQSYEGLPAPIMVHDKHWP
jgi:hypothetical protein